MNRQRLLFPVTAIALLLVLAYAAYGPRAEEQAVQPVTKWEYKTVYFRWGRTEKGGRTESLERIEEVLNDLGAKGWELSETVSDVAGDTDRTMRVTMSTNFVAIFKRPKR